MASPANKEMIEAFEQMEVSSTLCCLMDLLDRLEKTKSFAGWDEAALERLALAMLRAKRFRDRLCAAAEGGAGGLE